MYNVLVCDDEKDIVSALQIYLKRKKETTIMKKRVLAVILGAVMTMSLAACGSSDAGKTSSNDSEKSYTIGISQFAEHGSLNNCRTGFLEGLKEAGIEEGVNLTVLFDNAQADTATASMISDNYVSQKVDLICAIATPSAMSAYNSCLDSDIPVIYTAVSDPVSAGLVADLNAPGANITGTSDALDTTAVMKLITAANPDVKKIGLLYDKSQDSSKVPVADAIAYCEENGIEYIEKTGTTNAEVSAAADALVAEGVDAVFTPTDNTIMTAELAIFEKFADAKIPHYTGADSFALNGAFLGYGVNYTELGTATADMAADILVNGADPAATAVRTLDSGIVTVNTETAAAVGIDDSVFKDMCEELKEVTTAEEFE